MRNATREQFSQLQAAMLGAYGAAAAAGQKFEITIPKEIALNDKVQESDAFLQMITMAGVTDTTGQALDLGVDGMLAKRTDTNNKSRQPHILGGPDGSEWTVKLTEFDVGIKYITLDQWARYPDFLQRYMKHVYRAIALSRLSIGWHGKTAAAESDPQANPNGEDVNIGWLQTLKTGNSANYMTEGATAGKITIGAAGDYKNLDALVYDLYQGIPIHRRTGNEVAIIGSALIADDVNKGLNKHAQTPTEKNVGITTLAGSYGGIGAIQVPKFHDMGVMVTDPANLQLLYQEGQSRRMTKDEPERNRVVDYISSNDAYAIRDLKAAAAVEAGNVEFKES